MPTVTVQDELPNEQRLKHEGSLAVKQVSGIKVVDQKSYDLVVNYLADKIKPFLKKCDEFFDPNIKKAHELHRSLLDQKKSVTEKALAIEKAKKQELVAWVDAAKKEQERLDREARERQEKEHQESLLAQAVEAEEMGASEEEKEAILQQPNLAPAPIASPVFQKSSKAPSREKWKGQVTNLKDLCLAIGQGKVPVNAVIPNASVINGLCNASREATQIPGVRAYPDINIAIRSYR